VTTVTAVMILNYAVGLDVARKTQSNTKGVWPCKLPMDSLQLQLLAMSPDLMSDLNKQTRQNFPSSVRDEKQVTVRCDEKKMRNTQKFNKFDK